MIRLEPETCDCGKKMEMAWITYAEGQPEKVAWKMSSRSWNGFVRKQKGYLTAQEEARVSDAICQWQTKEMTRERLLREYGPKFHLY